MQDGVGTGLDGNGATPGQWPVGAADPRRLAALDGYGILDTLREQSFDDAVRLAARLCATPVALVTLVTADRQWFKARIGFPYSETDLSRSICVHVLGEPDLLVIPDLSTDPRTAANPLIADDPRFRFYAGAPLRTPDGQVLGSLCVIDTAPRPGGLSAEQADDLRALAGQVMALLSLRQAVRERLDREATMRESEARSRRAQEAGRVGTYEIDIASGLSEVSPELCRIYGLPPARRYPASLFTHMVVPEDREIPSTEATRKAGTAVLEIKYRVRRANDGALRWIERTARFTRHPDGTPATMFGTVRDITEQQVLTEELSHRLKNTFAIVLSIAAQSFRHVTDRAPVQAFEKRIRALSAAHDVLLRQSWGAAPIDDVVRSVLTGTGQSDRVDIGGPLFDLGPRAVLSLSLLLHELATNATKYGSLSVPNGRVAASWRVEGEAGADELVLDWIESGGPPAVAPASTDRRGFGSRLIQMGLTGTGGVELLFLPEGLRARIRAPVSHLRHA